MPIADEPHDDDAPVTLRNIDWRSTFPFTLIFRSFRVAIHPSKLVLALIALLLIYVGGNLLDGLWRVRPQYRAVQGELALFEETRTATNPSDEFNTIRNTIITQNGKRNGGTLEDRRTKILAQRDVDVAAAKKAYDDAPATGKYDAALRRDGEILEAYRSATASWESAKIYAHGVGPFHAFFDYELSQLNRIQFGMRSGNWIGRDGMTDGLINFLVIAPHWGMRHHPIFFTLFGVWFLVIWSIFGGAIARIAAVHIARDEKISIRQALAFSVAKFLSFFSAPLIPLVIVGVIGLVVALGGVLGNIPVLGPPLIGALFFLALIAGFVMTLVLLGAVGGVNLMYPTIAVEGSDSFDAISRSFSYLYARPWRLVFYTLVAMIYGGLCYIFVRSFIYVMLWVTHVFAGMWFRFHADNTAPLWNTMWPNPMTNGRLTYNIDFLTLGPAQDVGAVFLAIWVYLTISLLGAFAISLYFSANTVIYFLMRNEVDATELDDVYLEQGEEDFMDAAPAGAGAGGDAMPASSAPGAGPGAGPGAALDSVSTGAVTMSDTPPAPQAPESPPQP